MVVEMIQIHAEIRYLKFLSFVRYGRTIDNALLKHIMQQYNDIFYCICIDHVTVF